MIVGGPKMKEQWMKCGNMEDMVNVQEAKEVEARLSMTRAFRCVKFTNSYGQNFNLGF
jgi:hypothetical protein